MDSSQFLIFVWIRFEKDQIAVFAERDQAPFGQDHVGAAKTLLRPANLTRGQLDAAQSRAFFLPAVAAIQKAVLIDARVVVIGHDLALPDFLDFMVVNAKENSSGSVARGNEHLILHHQGGSSGDRRPDAR